MKIFQNFFVSLPRNEANGIITLCTNDAFAVVGKG